MNQMMLFHLTIYEDGRITDNYPKVILGNQIKQDIYSILDHGKLEYTNVDIRFIESDQEYVTFEDYKSNHNVLIFSDLKGWRPMSIRILKMHMTFYVH